MSNKVCLSFTILYFTIQSVVMATTAPVEGHWEGVIQIRPAELEVDFALDLRRREDGLLSGEVTFPTQGAVQPLESATLENGKVAFVTRDPEGVVSSFSGALSERADEIQGRLLEKGADYAFRLTRSVSGPVVPSAPFAMAGTGQELRTRFNQDEGDVRLVLILSPTCPMCKSAARLVQRYVLDEIADPRLKTYIVWEGINAGDTQESAAKVASLVTDPRVTQFWAADRFVGAAFRGPVGLKSEPAWDVFLLFTGSKHWDEAAPTPDFLMSNMKTQEQIPAHPRLNGTQLAEKVRAALAATPAVSKAEVQPCH